MVAKKMGRNEIPVVIVVSPLDTFMEDQVKEATEMGITAMQFSSVDNHESLNICHLLQCSDWL